MPPPVPDPVCCESRQGAEPRWFSQSSEGDMEIGECGASKLPRCWVRAESKASSEFKHRQDGVSKAKCGKRGRGGSLRSVGRALRAAWRPGPGPDVCPGRMLPVRETFFDLQPRVKLSVTQSSSCNSSFVPLSSISFFLLKSITHLPAFRYQAPLGKGMMCRGRFYFPITPFPAYTKCLEVGIGCCL